MCDNFFLNVWRNLLHRHTVATCPAKNSGFSVIFNINWPTKCWYVRWRTLLYNGNELPKVFVKAGGQCLYCYNFVCKSTDQGIAGKKLHKKPLPLGATVGPVRVRDRSVREVQAYKVCCIELGRLKVPCSQNGFTEMHRLWRIVTGKVLLPGPVDPRLNLRTVVGGASGLPQVQHMAQKEAAKNLNITEVAPSLRPLIMAPWHCSQFKGNSLSV